MPPRRGSAASSDTTTAAAGTPGRPRHAPRHQLRPITPEYVESLRLYARLMFEGGLTGGKDCKRPEALAAKIEVGRDVGLPATMAASWIAIVNGRPTIYGDGALALIRASGLLDAEPREWYEGTEGEDDYTAFFAVKRVDAPEFVVSFSVGDARRAKLWGNAGPWTTYPYRQLMWRAKGFACRDKFQDVLCGLTLTEEAIDTPGAVVGEPLTPASLPPGPPAAAESPTPVAPPAAVAPEPAARMTARLPDGTPIASWTTTEGGEHIPDKAGQGGGDSGDEDDADDDAITDKQVERFKQLRAMVAAHRGCKSTGERDEVWSELLLKTACVPSVMLLTRAQADQVIATIAEKYDPFLTPAGAAPSPA